MSNSQARAMNTSPTLQQEAARILLTRRLARNSAAAFANAIDVPGRPATDDPDEWVFHPIETSIAAHHLLMLNAADDLIEGRLVHEGKEADGVMAFMPPGSAKSTYLDVVVPTYVMGKRPGYQVILTGYGSDILRKHGRRARQVCSSEKFQAIFNTTIRSDNRSAEEWSLENGSEYMSGGLLSGLTGNRGNLLIVDDPIKGRQDAESELIRNRTWEAYADDALTRLKPGGKQFMILTRWHEDDPAGRILPLDWAGESGFVEGRDGRLWYVICLQAQCERKDDPLGREIGEFMWPEWFTPEHLLPFKRNPRAWRSLFQQVPTSDEGTFFKREWFGTYEAIPKHLNIYMSGDFAVTPDGGDETYLLVWGVTPDDDIYLLDSWYGQTDADVWITEIIERIKYWKPLWFIGETGPIRRAIEPILKRRMRDDNARCAIEWMSHATGSKEANARPFQALCSMRQVYFPVNADAERIRDQLLRFPSGRMDDAVDACSLMGRFIDRTWAQSPVKEHKETIVPADQPLIIEQMYRPHKQDSW